MNMLKEEHKKMLASYGRSVLAGVAALYVAGVTDPKELWAALIAAIAPVALRALNPNDTAFGKIPAAKAVEDAMKTIKKPVNKATKKA